MNNWRTVSPYMTEDEAWNELADLEMLGIHYNLEEKMEDGPYPEDFHVVSPRMNILDVDLLRHDCEDAFGSGWRVEKREEREEKMARQIILTREEAREAIEVGCFFGHDPQRYECAHFVERGDSICLLCKRLAGLAEGGDEEIEREEREMGKNIICRRCGGLKRIETEPCEYDSTSGSSWVGFCGCSDQEIEGDIEPLFERVAEVALRHDFDSEEIERDIAEAVKVVREAREMIAEYTNYAKQEIRFCPYCGAALGIV